MKSPFENMDVTSIKHSSTTEHQEGSLWSDSYGFLFPISFMSSITHLESTIFILIQKDNLTTACWLMLQDYYNTKNFLAKSLQSILIINIYLQFLYLFNGKTYNCDYSNSTLIIDLAIVL